MNDRGRIRVITGEGKGKTTSALGLAIGAGGKGLKVFMAQFLKTPDTSGEHVAVEALDPSLRICPMGRRGFIHRRGIEPEDRQMARQAVEMAREEMMGGYYDVIVLDEINVAIHVGLIVEEDLLHIIDAKPPRVELIITGRYALPSVIERADTALEMRKIKHHFESGIPPREGIEY